MEFRLLGGIEADLDGVPVPLGPARQKIVLAAMLMDVNRTVTTDELVYRVWGDEAPRRAKDTLYAYLSRLRRVLPAPQVDISRRSGGYAVVTDQEAIDVRRFRRLVDEARRAVDDVSAASTFQRALALWHGKPFADVDTPWFNAARDALIRERQAAELDSVDVRLRLGEHAALLTVLSDLSTTYPLDERLAAQHMIALYRCGRQTEALAHYRHVRTVLADELGIDPGAELQQLHQAILNGDAELSSLPAAPAPQPARAEATWTVQCQLPLDTPAFVGRAELISRLEEDLTGPAAALVVVSGSPGVGKSALAVHVGHRLRETFPDGQWYAHLAGNSGRPRDPAEVLSSLLRASGLDPQTIPEPLDDRATLFRSRLADRRVLLVLDDAASADQVRPLLPGTAGVAVLVTSRSDLRGLAVSHAARTVPLDVLTPAEAYALLADTLGPARVAAEPEAAELLAGLCAHVPLALRIAAANLAARRGRSLSEYAAELADGGRLAKLSIAGDHQAAVRTAFDHSYAALDPDAARLFGLLGLHPGPDFTTEAAAALLDVPLPVAETVLDRLTTASLLQYTGGDRFQFHDLLRLYAAEHAAADPGQAAAWQRLCEWYLRTVDAATAFDYNSLQLPRPRAESTRFGDRYQALAWLEAERAAVTTLIVRTAESGPREISWQLADQLRLYFYSLRHTAEWKTTTTAALRAAEHADEVLAQAVLWNSLGLLRQHTGDGQGAHEALHTARDGYRKTGFTLGEVGLLANLAVNYALRGEMRAALDCQESSYPLLRDLDRPMLLTRALNTTGLSHVYVGEFDQAMVALTEAIEILRAIDRPSGVIGVLVNRALAHHGLGQYAEALADGTEALHLCQTHRRRTSEPCAYEILARTYRDTGQLTAAGTHAELSLQAARAVDDPSLLADSLIILGSVRHLEGHPDVAVKHLQEAVEVTIRSGLRHQEVDAHSQIARAHLACGATSTALDHANQSLTIARALELRPAEHRALTALAAIAQATGEVAEAAEHLAQAERIQAETGYHPSPADVPSWSSAT